MRNVGLSDLAFAGSFMYSGSKLLFSCRYTKECGPELPAEHKHTRQTPSIVAKKTSISIVQGVRFCWKYRKFNVPTVDSWDWDVFSKNSDDLTTHLFLG